MHGQIFSKDTQSIFFNYKEKPVQRMLDFDYVSGAAIASGAAMPCCLIAPYPATLWPPQCITC